MYDSVGMPRTGHAVLHESMHAVNVAGLTGILAGVLAIGCGSPHPTNPEPDAMVCEADASCWPDDGTTQVGWATLGTGRNGFEAMPTMLPIEYGTQDGFDLVANVKMDGLLPGNPDDYSDTCNSRTRIRAYFADTNVPLNYSATCPYHLGYRPSADGHYELAEGIGIVFETCWRAQHLIGKQVRIDLQLVDHDDNFATSSVTVTLAAPTGFYPIEPPMPGCSH